MASEEDRREVVVRLQGAMVPVLVDVTPLGDRQWMSYLSDQEVEDLDATVRELTSTRLVDAMVAAIAQAPDTVGEMRLNIETLRRRYPDLAASCDNAAVVLDELDPTRRWSKPPPTGVPASVLLDTESEVRAAQRDLFDDIA
ncbi:hypothetical protein B7486_73000 [cyanobacterium TDX16]|nr:hypothetical protein B7486_73000 [cyanobacterium TDX16]